MFQKKQKTKNEKCRLTDIQGDLNLKLSDYQSCSKVNEYLNLLFQHSFIRVITRPTRISKNNSTLLERMNTNSFLILALQKEF